MITTAKDMRNALRAHFAPKHVGRPEYATFFEVRNAAGFAANRSCDAMVMGLWPSRGLDLEGYEIKIARNDWRKELADPAKAESFAQYCDRWWIFAADGVVQADEVPQNWGWKTLDKGRIVVRKPAPRLEPKGFDRGFIASMLRRAHETIEGHANELAEAKIAAERAYLTNSHGEQVNREAKKIVELNAKARELGELLNDPELRFIDNEEIVAALKIVNKMGLSRSWNPLVSAINYIDDARAKIAKGLESAGVEVPAPKKGAA